MAVPFMDIQFLDENFDTTRCRYLIYDAFYSNPKIIFLKVIYKIEDYFKAVNFYLNMHYYEKDGNKI